MMICGRRAKLQAKEAALAEAKNDLQRRQEEVKSMAERFDGSLTDLKEEERQLAAEQSKCKEEEKLQAKIEKDSLASISAAEQSAQRLNEEVGHYLPLKVRVNAFGDKLRFKNWTKLQTLLEPFRPHIANSMSQSCLPGLHLTAAVF